LRYITEEVIMTLYDLLLQMDGIHEAAHMGVISHGTAEGMIQELLALWRAQ
jgi:hypothetical protein